MKRSVQAKGEPITSPWPSRSNRGASLIAVSSCWFGSVQRIFMEAATRLAERAGVDVTRVPGAHGPQFSCPAAFAEAVFGLTEEPGVG